MKRRQFLALGAAAAVAPALPALPVVEDLTEASLMRALIAARDLGAFEPVMIQRGYVFSALMPTLQRLSWSAAEDHTTWSVEPAAPAER